MNSNGTPGTPPSTGRHNSKTNHATAAQQLNFEFSAGLLDTTPEKKKNKQELALSRWLEFHELEELYEPLHSSGFTSLQSLITSYVTFTENDLEEMGVYKKGLRMQFLAILSQLRFFKLNVVVLRVEGLPSQGFFTCGPTRRRVVVSFHDAAKITNASAEKVPAYNLKFSLGPWEESKIREKDLVVEMDLNGKKESACSIGFDEIPTDEEEGAKPFPLVNNKTGAFGGVAVMKVWLKRSEEFDAFLKAGKDK